MKTEMRDLQKDTEREERDRNKNSVEDWAHSYNLSENKRRKENSPDEDSLLVLLNGEEMHGWYFLCVLRIYLSLIVEIFLKEI